MNIFFYKLKNIVIFNILISITVPLICFAQSDIELDSIVKARMANYVKSDISIRGKFNVGSEVNMGFINKDVFVNYNLRSNIQANIYGVTIPLTFTYSNGRTTYGYGLNPIKLPSFNRIGLSPKFKDLTLHVGYRQLQYTKYTLNNLQFKGVGVEYQPKNYYFSVMKGTLKPAIAEDNLDVSLLEPSFQRNSWALKTGIQNEVQSLGLAFISVIDDAESLTNYTQFNQKIKPRENAVIGVYYNRKLFENLTFDIDYAFSGLSYDIVNDPFLDIGTQYTAYNYFGLFTTRDNSIYDKAFNSSLTYTLKKYTLGLNIERVDPDFRSMGSFFFNNNFITRTGSLGGTILDEKIQFNIEIGGENKAELKENEKDVARIIGSTGIKYKVNDRLSMNAKYSNMNNSSYVRKPSIQSNLIDSILQTQTKERINFSTNYLLGKDKNHSIGFFSGYQRGLIVNNDQFVTTITSSTKNAGLTFTSSSEQRNYSISYSVSALSDISNNFITHSMTHSYNHTLNKASSIFSNTSLSIMDADRSKNIIFQNEIGYSKTYLKLHSISSSIGSQLGRSITPQEQNNIFMIILKISYNIAFNYKR